MRRSHRWAGWTGAALFLVAIAVGAPASAAARDGVAGRVVSGTTKEAVGGLEVVLHAFRDDAEVETKTAVTDADGGFSFSGLESGGGWSYEVSASYERADYRSGPVSAGADDVKLVVYEATTSTEDLTQLTWVVWLDREGDGAAVQHDIEIDNAGKKTYVGRQEVEEGERAVVQLSVAPGASDFQYLGVFMDCCALVRGDSFIHTRPVEPGRSQGTVRYTVPSLSELSFPVVFSTRSFTLLVPADMDVSAPGLTESGQFEDRGITYRALVASDLEPGSELTVTVGGLGGGVGATLAIIAGVGVIAAAAFLLVLRSVVRAGRRPRAAKDRRPARTPPRSARTRAAGVNGRRRRRTAVGNGNVDDDESDVSLLVEEIAALDVALDRGLLDAETHRRLRAAAKARLVRLREERAD